ncbi:transposase [Streptomyces sp. SAI-127]|nr:transposase [Streptomyces sp. SAI-127]
MTRAQLVDAEWEFIETYLSIGEYGPYSVRLRQQFEGVLRRFRTGGQWREMPAEFGAWSTVHNRLQVVPRAQVRAAARQAKAAMMTATRT